MHDGVAHEFAHRLARVGARRLAQRRQDPLARRQPVANARNQALKTRGVALLHRDVLPVFHPRFRRPVVDDDPRRLAGKALEITQALGEEQRPKVGDGESPVIGPEKALLLEGLQRLPPRGGKRPLYDVKVALDVEQGDGLIFAAAGPGGLRAPIRAGLLEDAPKLVRRHRGEPVSGSHEVAPGVVQRLPARTGGNLENEDAALRVPDLAPDDLDADPLEDSGDGPLRDLERPGPDNAPWGLVRDAENDAAAAFVGQSDAIAHQLLEIVPVLGFLEFKVLAFRSGIQQGLQFLDGREGGHSTLYTSEPLRKFPARRRLWPRLS